MQHFRGRNELSGQNHAVGPVAADGAGDKSALHAREDPQFDFGEAEARVFGRQNQVTQKSQFEAAAQSDAVDGHNDHFGELVEGHLELAQVVGAESPVGVAVSDEIWNVGPAAKGLGNGGLDEDDLDGVEIGESGQVGDQFVD